MTRVKRLNRHRPQPIAHAPGRYSGPTKLTVKFVRIYVHKLQNNYLYPEARRRVLFASSLRVKIHLF